MIFKEVALCVHSFIMHSNLHNVNNFEKLTTESIFGKNHNQNILNLTLAHLYDPLLSMFRAKNIILCQSIIRNWPGQNNVLDVALNMFSE